MPDNAEEEVDFHFVCFVKSSKNGHIYELDGDRKGPVDRGILSRPDEDMLAEGCLNIVREFIQRENDVNFNFSLMALMVASTDATPLYISASQLSVSSPFPLLHT